MGRFSYSYQFSPFLFSINVLYYYEFYSLVSSLFVVSFIFFVYCSFEIGTIEFFDARQASFKSSCRRYALSAVQSAYKFETKNDPKRSATMNVKIVSISQFIGLNVKSEIVRAYNLFEIWRIGSNIIIPRPTHL